MYAYDFSYSYFSQLQYSNINKDIKVCFSNELYNKEQGIKTHFLHFLLYVAISHFHNNEYAIISGLARGGIGSGNKLYWVCFVNFFDLNIYIGLVILN